MNNSYVTEAASSSRLSREMNSQQLLELLNTTTDINIQLKLFSALSALVMFGEENDLHVIIKCSAVYDKIREVLSKGLPRKATVVLRFLSALLYVDAEEYSPAYKTSLALFAKNMTRISGCLDVMTEFFTNSMMYHDTWQALCLCLAVACSRCELNQSCCAHLIPVCIQKCSPTNVDLFLLLHSLVLDHEKNMKLFLDCNGIGIFVRDVLSYNKCLQLLTTVVQSSYALKLLYITNVLDDLQDFVLLYGSDSEIGQKALIILNHVESRTKGKACHISSNNLTNRTDHTMDRDDYAKYNINSSNDTKSNDRLKHRYCNGINSYKSNTCDTKTLMDNVLKEVCDYVGRHNESRRVNGSSTNLKPPRIQRDLSIQINTKNNESYITSKKINHNLVRKRGSYNTELPSTYSQNYQRYIFADSLNNFSTETKGLLNFTPKTNEAFINSNKTNETLLSRKQDRHLSSDVAECSRKYVKANNSIAAYSKYNRNIENRRLYTEKKEKVRLFNTERNMSHLNMTRTKSRLKSMRRFQPAHASTPNISKLNIINRNETTGNKSNWTSLSYIKQATTNNEQKQQSRQVARSNSLANQSFSSRFFNTLNNSCTSIFKTVGNIFKKQNSERSHSNFNSSDKENDLSGSPINISLKNEEINNMVLNNNKSQNKKCRNNSESSMETKSCDTCDDTKILEEKLSHNQNLKQTIRMLKFGINLYGCDFKKISRTIFWKQPYMKPAYLYKLYRKLLCKKK